MDHSIYGVFSLLYQLSSNRRPPVKIGRTQMSDISIERRRNTNLMALSQNRTTELFY